MNLILADCIEQVYTGDAMIEEDLGVYFIRGDNIAVIGQVDALLEH
jgi:small nuclear ribonucleoprotein (snRNP)-like protein